ncbi:MAG: ABC transporter permease [Candidatus Acetothermia bacterium]
MYQYLIRRLLEAIPKLLLISILVFSMLHLAPGDPVITVVGPSAPKQAYEAARERLGLDRPLAVQYFKWLSATFQWDFGQSISLRKPVSTAIVERIPITLQFTLLGIFLMYLIGIPVGIISAIYRYSIIDHLLMGLVFLGISMPSFWFGLILLIIFGVQLQLVPVSGYGTFGLTILPALALAARGAALAARMTRSSMLEVMHEDCIRTARAKGLREAVVHYKHAIRNALIPVITLFGMRIGWSVAAGVSLEIVFSRPGVGRLLVESIFARDYPVVQAVILLLALAIILGNLFADALYTAVDPRIRYS